MTFQRGETAFSGQTPVIGAYQHNRNYLDHILEEDNCGVSKLEDLLEQSRREPRQIKLNKMIELEQ